MAAQATLRQVKDARGHNVNATGRESDGFRAGEQPFTTPLVHMACAAAGSPALGITALTLVGGAEEATASCQCSEPSPSATIAAAVAETGLAVFARIHIWFSRKLSALPCCADGADYVEGRQCIARSARAISHNAPSQLGAALARALGARGRTTAPPSFGCANVNSRCLLYASTETRSRRRQNMPHAPRAHA